MRIVVVTCLILTAVWGCTESSPSDLGVAGMKGTSAGQTSTANPQVSPEMTAGKFDMGGQFVTAGVVASPGNSAGAQVTAGMDNLGGSSVSGGLSDPGGDAILGGGPMFASGGLVAGEPGLAGHNVGQPGLAGQTMSSGIPAAGQPMGGLVQSAGMAADDPGAAGVPAPAGMDSAGIAMSSGTPAAGQPMGGLAHSAGMAADDPGIAGEAEPADMNSAGIAMASGAPAAGQPAGGMTQAAGMVFGGDPVPNPNAGGEPDMPPPQPMVSREDQFLEQKRAEFNWPGVAGLAFVDGVIVARGVSGVREAGEARALTDADRFHLGSCTKAMTGTLIGRLVDRGLVSFDDTLGDIFDDVRVHMNYQNVTLHQLLRHEGGTPRSLSTEQPAIWQYMWDNVDGDQRPIRREVARRLLIQEPANNIGQYTYSNAAYIIAGAALERITGQSWEDLVRAEIFGPLGMNGCGFGPPARAGVGDQPLGHRRRNMLLNVPVQPGRDDDNPPSLGPAGTVHCSLDAWVPFAAVHAGSGPAGYLAPDTLAALHQATPPSSYAGGWSTRRRNWAGGLALTHAGSNTMNYSIAWVAPAKRAGILIATNIAYDGIAGHLDEVVWALIQGYIENL